MAATVSNFYTLIRCVHAKHNYEVCEQARWNVRISADDRQQIQHRIEQRTQPIYLFFQKKSIYSYHFARLACFPPFAFPCSLSLSVPCPPTIFTLYMDPFNLFIHQFFPFSNTFFSFFSFFSQNKK